MSPLERDRAKGAGGPQGDRYLENILVHDEAIEAACADALFVGLKGELRRAPVRGIFLVVQGKLVTPKLPGILPGSPQVRHENDKVKERTVKHQGALERP